MKIVLIMMMLTLISVFLSNFVESFMLKVY